MGIFKVHKELIELTSLQTHPSRSYSSGAMDLPPGENVLTAKHGFNDGITGSISVVPRPSPVFKDFPQGMFVKFEADGTLGTTIKTEPFLETEEYVGLSPYEFGDYFTKLYGNDLGEIPLGTNMSGAMYTFVGMAEGELNVGPMSSSGGYTPIELGPGYESDGQPGIINQRRQPARNRKKKEIKIFRPPYRYEQLGTRAKNNDDHYPAEAGTYVTSPSGSARGLKDFIRNTLMPMNAGRYTDSQFAYKNYHTLNFFTGSGMPDGACLIYNNSTGAIPPMSAPFGLDHPHRQAGWDKVPTHWNYKELDYRERAPDTLPGLRAGRGPYTPTGSFTFEFWINPRYTNERTGDVSDGMYVTKPFNVGTIMHMPTVFAISLVPGSSVDASGLTDGYRIMLQLSHSAEIRPRSVRLSANSNVLTTSNEAQHTDDLMFVSDDNSLKRNHWHYVGIRWGTERVNHGTGTFIIDGEERGTIYVPSMSIAPQLPVANMRQAINATPTYDSPADAQGVVERTATSIALGTQKQTAEDQKGVPDPDILVIGNFYEGAGTGSLCPQESRLYNFFNLTASINEGIVPVRHSAANDAFGLGPGGTSSSGSMYARRASLGGLMHGQLAGTDPTDFGFYSQLNAEIHEIKIYDRYRSLEDIVTGSIEGPGTKLAYSRSMSLTSHADTIDNSTGYPSPRYLEDGLTQNPLYPGDGTPDDVGKETILKEQHTFRAESSDTSLLFYLPPFFVKESPNRSFLLNCVQSFKKDIDAARGFEYALNGYLNGLEVGPGSRYFGEDTWGGFSEQVLHVGNKNSDYPPDVGTPDEPKVSEALYPNKSTVLEYNSASMLSRPFNAGLSFSTDATLINVENFCREFIGGPVNVPDAMSDVFGFRPGNYPRLMYLTASSVAQKHRGAFNRYWMNVGRVNSIYAEQQLGESGARTTEGTYPADAMEKKRFNEYTAKVDGKFLTPVSGALDHFYSTGSLVRRNLALLPNDNGLFAPNYGWLLSGSVVTDGVGSTPGEKETIASFAQAMKDPLRPPQYSDLFKPRGGAMEPMSIFVDDDGELDLTLIGLQNLFDWQPGLSNKLANNNTSQADGGWEYAAQTSHLTGSPAAVLDTKKPTSDPWRTTFDGLVNRVWGFQDHVSPDNPDGWGINWGLNGGCGPGFRFDGGVIDPSYDFWIYQTTADPSSNEIRLIDISNLFYGQRIEAGTFRLRDPYYTGSSGKISITLRDDGNGGLYRADCLTKQAQWSNVGNIFYDEGVGIVKSPHIAHFGKDYFDCDFAGKQRVHIMTVNAFAPSSQANSSSNPSYLPLSATMNANDAAPEFNYITSINLHDENLNVIMRANLAQPVVKRWVDEFLFKIKLDF